MSGKCLAGERAAVEESGVVDGEELNQKSIQIPSMSAMAGWFWEKSIKELDRGGLGGL